MLSIERKKTLLFLASIEIVIAKFPHLEFLQLPRVFFFFCLLTDIITHEN